MTCEGSQGAVRRRRYGPDVVRVIEDNGIEGLANFGFAEGGATAAAAEQQDALKTWIAATLPAHHREVGAWISRVRYVAAPRPGQD